MAFCHIIIGTRQHLQVNICYIFITFIYLIYLFRQMVKFRHDTLIFSWNDRCITTLETKFWKLSKVQDSPLPEDYLIKKAIAIRKHLEGNQKNKNRQVLIDSHGVWNSLLAHFYESKRPSSLCGYHD